MGNITIQQSSRKKIVLITIAGCLILTSTILLIVGIVQLKKTQNCSVENGNLESKKLIDFLSKVKQTYYTTYPNAIVYDPDAELDKVIDNFNVYDPTPQAIKERTDLAYKLTQELKDLNLDKTKLKPREKKAAAQLEHYLDSIFGNPYNENYYAGDWMMGPNYFCWQSICEIGSDLKQHYSAENNILPKTVDQVDKIIDTLKKYKKIIDQVRENMNYGIKAGMVRAVDDCKSGENAFKGKFRYIVTDGEKGALRESFSRSLTKTSYYNKLSAEMRHDLKTKYGKEIEVAVAETIVDYIGKPLDSFIKYLGSNYSRHCVPSDIASGLANLPLDKVWLDQKETDQTTTKKLPTGETLDGKKSYEMILPYFTTSKKYDSKTVYELGKKQRDQLYLQAVRLAKIITKKNDSSAVTEFKADLDMPKHFFNTSVIPDNENGDIGGSRCRDMESAKINCPVRYKAMQDWFAFARQLLAKIEPLTVDMFYMTGERSTTPNCPVKMQAKFNPSSGSQSYSSAGKNCTRACYYQLPFFLKRPGPKYSAFSVAGHEGRPGHHTQVQGFDEHFSSSGNKNDVIDWLNANNYYTAFTEGWALYSENPLLSKGTKLYEDEPVQEYGMLKWQIWRALRLVIDTGLHARGMTQTESMNLFEKYAWDTTDKSLKDTIRYMSSPGQATAYMIGQLEIWSMRNKTKEAFSNAGIPFDEKEFHYQVLSQGSSPLEYLIGYIDDFITCKINKDSRSDCPEILDPKLADKQKGKPIGSKERWNFIIENLQHTHYD